MRLSFGSSSEPVSSDGNVQYFGDTNNAAAAASADPDGDGQNNMAEFFTGTGPINSASAFRITSVAYVNTNALVSWTMGSNRTNALQVTTGDSTGSYNTNNFIDIFAATNTVGVVTNCLDLGAATNIPARFYRVRLCRRTDWIQPSIFNRVR